MHTCLHIVFRYSCGRVNNDSLKIVYLFIGKSATTYVSMVESRYPQAINASSGFFEIIDSDRVRVDGLQEPQVSAHGDIEFHSVTFAYPARTEVKVLKDCSACFKKGKNTALVGPSGSGKSTIISLLERWYQLGEVQDPQQIALCAPSTPNDAEKTINIEGSERGGLTEGDYGTVTVDGHNINNLSLKERRSQIGLVQQEPFLFNDSILNNITYGLIGSKWENGPAEVKEQLGKSACREAYADEFINRPPEGYSTIVGVDGIKLSEPLPAAF